MIDPRDRILMARLRYGDGFDGWVLPGGGIEDGEDHRQALVRELTEETGAPQVFMGPPLWHQTTLFPEPLVLDLLQVSHICHRTSG